MCVCLSVCLSVCLFVSIGKVERRKVKREIEELCVYVWVSIFVCMCVCVCVRVHMCMCMRLCDVIFTVGPQQRVCARIVSDGTCAFVVGANCF